MVNITTKAGSQLFHDCLWRKVDFQSTVKGLIEYKAWAYLTDTKTYFHQADDIDWSIDSDTLVATRREYCESNEGEGAFWVDVTEYDKTGKIIASYVE